MKKNMMKMMLATVILTSACSDSPTGPDNAVKIGNPIFTSTPVVSSFTGYTPSNWTNKNETPNNPPNQCDCPVGVRTPFWNNNNWVCTSSFNREMPTKNAFCSME